MKDKTKYKYSFIIPCYTSSESDFRRCLDYIKNQPVKSYEVICVDDCSPLDAPKIAKEYGFKYIRHEKNKHNGGAINTRIKEAQEILDSIEIDLILVKEIKDYLFSKTQPGAMKLTFDKTTSFQKSDKFLDYVEKLEQKGIDEKLKDLLTRKQIVEKWLNAKLEQLRQSKQIEQLVVYYRECVLVKENGTKRQMTWEEISKKIYYSEDYCKHIYSCYNKNTR